MVHNVVLGIEVAAATLLFYAVCTIVYNLYFHPLRNFPGPKLAAASKLPYIYNRLAGLQVRWTTELHDKYGECVRLSPNQLSFISASAWRDIYGHKVGAKSGLQKDWKFYGPDLVGSNGITRANDEDHARQRRALSHAFSDKALYQQEPILQRHVRVMMEKLGQIARAPPGTTDMVRFYNYCLFDITGELVFGVSLSLLEKSIYRPWAAAVLGAVKTFALVPAINATFPRFGALIKRLLLPSALDEGRKLHGVYVREQIDARLARERSPADHQVDMWNFVMRHNGDSEKGLALNEMYAVGGNLMIGGTETSATLLSGLTWYLLNDSDKMAALCKEIRDAFARPEDISMLSVAQLPYLRACLQEALRHYPPVATGMPRLVPAEGHVISGKQVPGGTTVYVSHYAAYHSHRYFYEPYKFMPERWATKPDDKFAHDEFNVVEPFSYGPRNCIGKNLAFHQMRLIYANLLWHFDLELCPETKQNWDDQLVFNIWEKPQLICKLKPVVRD